MAYGMKFVYESMLPWALILIFFSQNFSWAASNFQLEEIKECVREKQSAKNYKRVPSEDTIELDCGDPASEELHVLSVHAMKSNEILY